MLAIGLLVDDAIVVVENVERLMDENPGMTPARGDDPVDGAKSRSRWSRSRWSLSAVFLPMAFFGGSTGVIYRQFSLTIVSAMVLSVLVALILSPALTATLLRQSVHERSAARAALDRRFPAVGRPVRGAQDWFNRTSPTCVDRYRARSSRVVDRKWLFLGIYAADRRAARSCCSCGFRPASCRPRTRARRASSSAFPPGATQARTLEVQRRRSSNISPTTSRSNVQTLFTVAGGGGGGGAVGQNTGQGFINFAHWDERQGKENTADAIAQRAIGRVPQPARRAGLRAGARRDPRPRPVERLHDASFRTRGGMSREAVHRRARPAARRRPTTTRSSTSVRLSDLPDVATLKIDIDQQKLTALGLNQGDVNSTLSTAWGGRYVNDFIDRGRVKRVYVQGDAPYRAEPEDLAQWYVRSSNGEMAPFSSFARIGWATAPEQPVALPGRARLRIPGPAGAGRQLGRGDGPRSTQLAREIPGHQRRLGGRSPTRSGCRPGQAPLLYAMSLLVVFLCLAALYESWSIPVAVLLVIPLGLVGAIFAVTLRGLENDVYLQIGLLTTMGLAAKNAILMIEFAERREKQGMRVIDAALEAARIRLRPILMTSFAFIFGVLPLAISTGAGANSRIAIGTSVIGGMLTATLLAIFYIPLFFVLVRRGVRDGLASSASASAAPRRAPRPA